MLVENERLAAACARRRATKWSRLVQAGARARRHRRPPARGAPWLSAVALYREAAIFYMAAAHCGAHR
jgi:hypothetical protein